MRGKRAAHESERGTRGNIPAYAGKTCSGQMNHSAAREHPRVCGENGAGVLPFVELQGTSPRMRGKPDEQYAEVKALGNIPAYAGKTFF